MFDAGFLLVLIFLGIVLWGRLKLAAQVQRRQAALSLNKPQPQNPLPRQNKPEPVKAERQPVPSFEGREGGALSPGQFRPSVKKSFGSARSPMISGFTDSSVGFDREWKQDSSSVQQQNQLRQEPNKSVMPIFARDNLLQSFIAHEVLNRPKFRQGDRRV